VIRNLWRLEGPLPRFLSRGVLRLMAIPCPPVLPPVTVAKSPDGHKHLVVSVVAVVVEIEHLVVAVVAVVAAVAAVTPAHPILPIQSTC
jgi:hypothetical protein